MTIYDLELLIGFAVLLVGCGIAFGVVQSKIKQQRANNRLFAKRERVRSL